jgi:hypothetical protein
MLWSVLSHRALRRRDRSAGVAPCRHFLWLYAGRDWYNYNIGYDIFEPLLGFSLTNVCCRFLVVYGADRLEI